MKFSDTRPGYFKKLGTIANTLGDFTILLGSKNILLVFTKLVMSLVYHYRLDEANASEIGTEYVSGTNTATTSGITSIVYPTYGNVANFADSRFAIGNMSSLINNNSRTYSLWVSFDSGLAATHLMSTGTGSSWDYLVGNNPNPRFYTNGNAGVLGPGVDLIVPDTWYHVVCTYDNNAQLQVLYVNGTSIGTEKVHQEMTKAMIKIHRHDRELVKSQNERKK